MKTALLIAAILSLVAGLWNAWAFFQGQISRDQMLRMFYLASLVWFVCATWWAYRKGGA
jgi:hypothetical protein